MENWQDDGRNNDDSHDRYPDVGDEGNLDDDVDGDDEHPDDDDEEEEEGDDDGGDLKCRGGEMGLHAVGAHNWWDTQHQHHRALDSGDPHTSNFRGARHGIRLQIYPFYLFVWSLWAQMGQWSCISTKYGITPDQKCVIARSHVANMHMLDFFWISHVHSPQDPGRDGKAPCW